MHFQDRRTVTVASTIGRRATSKSNPNVWLLLTACCLVLSLVWETEASHGSSLKFWRRSKSSSKGEGAPAEPSLEELPSRYKPSEGKGFSRVLHYLKGGSSSHESKSDRHGISSRHPSYGTEGQPQHSSPEKSYRDPVERQFDNYQRQPDNYQRQPDNYQRQSDDYRRQSTPISPRPPTLRSPDSGVIRPSLEENYRGTTLRDHFQGPPPASPSFVLEHPTRQLYQNHNTDRPAYPPASKYPDDRSAREKSSELAPAAVSPGVNRIEPIILPSARPLYNVDYNRPVTANEKTQKLEDTKPVETTEQKLSGPSTISNTNQAQPEPVKVEHGNPPSEEFKEPIQSAPVDVSVHDQQERSFEFTDQPKTRETIETRKSELKQDQAGDNRTWEEIEAELLRRLDDKSSEPDEYPLEDVSKPSAHEGVLIPSASAEPSIKSEKLAQDSIEPMQKLANTIDAPVELTKMEESIDTIEQEQPESKDVETLIKEKVATHPEAMELSEELEDSDELSAGPIIAPANELLDSNSNHSNDFDLSEDSADELSHGSPHQIAILPGREEKEEPEFDLNQMLDDSYWERLNEQKRRESRPSQNAAGLAETSTLMEEKSEPTSEKTKKSLSMIHDDSYSGPTSDIGPKETVDPVDDEEEDLEDVEFESSSEADNDSATLVRWPNLLMSESSANDNEIGNNKESSEAIEFSDVNREKALKVTEPIESTEEEEDEEQDLRSEVDAAPGDVSASSQSDEAVKARKTLRNRKKKLGRRARMRQKKQANKSNSHDSQMITNNLGTVTGVSYQPSIEGLSKPAEKNKI